MSKRIFRRSNTPGSLQNIKDNHQIVKGLEKDIKRKLSISFCEATVNEIMNKIYLIEEYSLELGIDISRYGYDQKAKVSLWKAREEREREV